MHSRDTDTPRFCGSLCLVPIFRLWWLVPTPIFISPSRMSPKGEWCHHVSISSSITFVYRVVGTARVDVISLVHNKSPALSSHPSRGYSQENTKAVLIGRTLGAYKYIYCGSVLITSSFWIAADGSIQV
ncbi:unnamed protein product [Periconia digitata]|uniref:Uncharacterized protein n=1 Tax=Periconia digitata TaxID=1303443 RepID=A0A9W4XS39_9PLEO|nr:unnamed protein product [Periconia digitata]